MFSSKLSLGAVAALALASSANAIATDLTADNFDSLVGGGKGSFIKFYAPWCVRSIRERCLISMFGARRVASRRGVAREGFGRASDRRLIVISESSCSPRARSRRDRGCFDDRMTDVKILFRDGIGADTARRSRRRGSNSAKRSRTTTMSSSATSTARRRKVSAKSMASKVTRRSSTSPVRLRRSVIPTKAAVTSML